MSCATCLRQLHKFVVTCVACNWILVANDSCKTQNFLIMLIAFYLGLTVVMYAQVFEKSIQEHVLVLTYQLMKI
jgi:hypothetical protein